MAKVILQIANDYSGSKVYKNLFLEFDKFGLEQVVYTAIRRNDLVDRNSVSFQSPFSRILYRDILKWMDRWLYYSKINKIYIDVLRCVNVSSLSVIHAHTWFSDGGVAFLLHRKLKLPFHVTVRSTDLFVFFKFFPFLRGFAKRILLAADSVIFVSPALLLRFRSLVGENFYSKISNKINVLPNGVDDFWLNNKSVFKNSLSTPIRALYVGTFIKRKNVVSVIDAIKLLREKGFLIELILVGGGGAQHKGVMKIIDDLHYVNYLGKIPDLTEMLRIYRYSDFFVMPSYGETFGLVYIEALLQGCPVIYLKDDAIDGLYDFKIGSVAQNSSTNAVFNAINDLIVNYDLLEINQELIACEHNWNFIAKKFLKIYGIK